MALGNLFLAPFFFVKIKDLLELLANGLPIKVEAVSKAVFAEDETNKT